MLPFRKAHKTRFLKIAVSLLIVLFSCFLWLKAYQNAFDLYLSPSDLQKEPAVNTHVRLGGYVKKNSIVYKNPHHLEFIIEDQSSQILVEYQGAVPALFKEGIETIATGRMVGSSFMAEELFVKHDQNYRLKRASHAS